MFDKLRSKVGVVVAAVTASPFLAMGVASAQEAQTPADAVTTIGGSVSSAVQPAMIAAVTAVVGLLALGLAIKYLIGLVRRVASR